MPKAAPKPKKFNPAQALPCELDKPSLSEVLEAAGGSARWGGDAGTGLGLLALLGGKLTSQEATELLLEHAGYLRSSIHGNDKRMGGSPSSLVWAQALVDAGADPFASKGERKNYDFKASLFERAIGVGSWAYARALAFESEASLARAREVVQSMGEKPTDSGWGVETRCGPWWRARLFHEGGRRGLELAFDLGLDPNQVHAGSPWVFCAGGAEELAAFAKAGADLSAKDAGGRGLREKVCAHPEAKAREGMLKVLASHGTGSAQEAAQALGSLAKTGKWREVAALAKEAGVDPASMKIEGSTLAAIAMGAGNWELAAQLVEKGAPLWDPCPLSRGGPAILAVAWGPDGAWTESQLKRDKVNAARGSIVDRIDWSWRSARGEKFLEAAKRVLAAQSSSLSSRAGSLHLSAVKAAIAKDPQDASDPLWSRLAKMEPENDWALRAAALSRGEEPWVDGSGKTLMGALVERASAPRQSSFERGLAAFEQEAMPKAEREGSSWHMPSKGAAEELDAWARKLCEDPRQWEEGLSEVFGDALADKSATGERRAELARDALFVRMKRWMEESERMGVEAFDFERLGPALARAVGKSNRAAALAKHCVLKRPDRAGGALLDLIELGWGSEGDYEARSNAVAAAREIWAAAKAQSVEIDFPQGHRLMSQPGAVGSKLAQDPLWVAIEADVVARASRPGRRLGA